MSQFQQALSMLNAGMEAMEVWARGLDPETRKKMAPTITRMVEDAIGKARCPSHQAGRTHPPREPITMASDALQQALLALGDVGLVMPTATRGLVEVDIRHAIELLDAVQRNDEGSDDAITQE